MDTRINIVQNVNKDSKDIVRILTIFVLGGLINPKYKYLHWKLINRVGLTYWLDMWIYALNTADVPEMAVVGLCRRKICRK